MSLAFLQQESTPPHPESIWALSYTPSHLISGASDGHLRIWDPQELTVPIHDIESNPLAIASLSTNASGEFALSTSLEGRVTLVDVKEGRIVARVDTARQKVMEGENELPAYSAAIHPSTSCWAWSGRSSKLALRNISQDDISSLAANATAAAEDEGQDETKTNGHRNGHSKQLDIGSGPLAGDGGGKVVDTGKGKFGMDVKFSPDGQQVALGTESGQIIVVDTTTQSVVATYASHAMAVRTISWSPDSQWLFSGSDDHRIVLHDVRAGSRSGGASGRGEGAVAILQGHQSWVLKVAASPDAKLLGSGGADGLIKLWDVGQRSCVSTTTSTTGGEVWALEWQPGAANTYAVGKQFAVAGEDKMVTLYRAAGVV